MSNEVNIVETAYGVIDPGYSLEIYDWSGDFEETRKKARFFTVVPDTEIPIGDGIYEEYAPEFGDALVNLEIIRTWTTVWVHPDHTHTFQRNVAIKNIGPATTAFHLLRAETDN